MSVNDIPALLQSELNLTYESLTFDQLRKVISEYDLPWYTERLKCGVATKFYVVPLSHAGGLLHKYSPIRGRVYIEAKDLKAVAVEHFRAILHQSLSYTERSLAGSSTETENYSLNEFLQVLRDPSKSRDYNSIKLESNQINLQNLD